MMLYLRHDLVAKLVNAEVCKTSMRGFDPRPGLYVSCKIHNDCEECYSADNAKDH